MLIYRTDKKSILQRKEKKLMDKFKPTVNTYTERERERVERERERETGETEREGTEHSLKKQEKKTHALSIRMNIFS